VWIDAQDSPNSVSTRARSSRLQNDENLVSDCRSIYNCGKPRTDIMEGGEGQKARAYSYII